MYAWESIKNTLDYIENHLGEAISIDELSAQAALSPFYYQRLFSRIVKKPVMEYIKLRRLAHSCKLLKEEDKIINIALESGFASPEVFTRTFKEVYGMTPTEYRSKPVMMNQFDKPELQLNRESNEDLLISDGIVFEIKTKIIQDSIHFIGISDYIPYELQLPIGEVCGVDLPGQLWMKFHDLKQELPCISNGREIGVSYFDEKTPQGCFKYFVGAETKCLDSDYEVFELPAREYIVCTFEAETFDELVTTALNKAIQFITSWMITHEYTMDVFAPEIYTADNDSMMELWYPYKVNK